jgi:hypothetical protein
MDQFSAYRVAVSRSVSSLAREFVESPESFLYESDLQGRLYSKLLDALAAMPVFREGESYWCEAIGRTPLRINPARSEYPDSTRFDIALLDTEAPGVPVNVWNMPVRVAIELKFRQAIGGGPGIEDDEKKLRNYKEARRGAPFTGVCLLFSHRRDDAYAMELRRRYVVESPTKFEIPADDVTAWVITA